MPLSIQNKDNHPNSAYLGSGFAYAASDKPLKSLTKYRVRATVKANGVTTLVDYTFTTGQLTVLQKKAPLAVPTGVFKGG